MDKFFEAYVVAALCSSTEQGEPLDENYDKNDIHKDTLQKMQEDCEKFQEENKNFLIDKNCLTSFNVEEQGGHDFWLTRNGHGAGFWETSDWEVEAGRMLTKSAHRFGEFVLYVGDDGLIHGTK